MELKSYGLNVLNFYFCLLINIKFCYLFHAYLILIDLIILTISGEEKSQRFSLRNFLKSSFASSPLVPNIFLRTLLSDILKTFFSLKVREYVKNSHKTVEILGLYILINVF
jgi:hypothetical protein